MTIFSRKPTCPYCKNQLEKAPKRKSKCPLCKKIIYVHNGKLITEEESQLFDWLGYLENLGITEQKLEQSREELSKQFKMRASVLDTVWYILNNLIAAHPFSETAIRAYYEMARVANYEHKDEKPYIVQALRTQLNSLKLRGIKKVRVVGYAMGYDGIEQYDCTECAKLRQKTFSIDEALEKMPIPCNEPYASCTCRYEAA